EHGHGKGLPHIPGIGVSIGEKIIEMLTTGRCGHHEELLRALPHGVLDILKISGVGPRKAAVLYKELGIKSVAELADAAFRKKLRDLPGFGEKTEENILKGIKDRQAVSGRHNIAAARQCAGSFMEYILKIPGVIEAVPAGSLRRWKDSIGDIDILTWSWTGSRRIRT
ncbi:MAG: DNA polymerase III, partial [Deltaproteobacteria bacterium]|nr:DNA polymerase III [Deltaproteobacteria bacterium]